MTSRARSSLGDFQSSSRASKRAAKHVLSGQTLPVEAAQATDGRSRHPSPSRTDRHAARGAQPQAATPPAPPSAPPLRQPPPGSVTGPAGFQYPARRLPASSPRLPAHHQPRPTPRRQHVAVARSRHTQPQRPRRRQREKLDLHREPTAQTPDDKRAEASGEAREIRTGTE
ncbi:hypothetical protein CDD83_253 [Cordyceps sp. RAO-2017]|nr:hypothetical protein CDD83_253 [Cordyceps sp. RAO-2017]